MSTGLTKRFREAEERQEIRVSRSIERAHLEAAARRHAEEAERLRERSKEQGLEDVAEWFDTSRTAAQGARKALKESEL
jgi:hypothetical protein